MFLSCGVTGSEMALAATTWLLIRFDSASEELSESGNFNYGILLLDSICMQCQAETKTNLWSKELPDGKDDFNKENSFQLQINLGYFLLLTNTFQSTLVNYIKLKRKFRV